MLGVDNVYGDPWCEATFEATVADSIVDRTSGQTRWSWRDRGGRGRGERGTDGGPAGAG